MKISECIEQLTTMVEAYNNIIGYHDKICNMLVYIDKNKLTYIQTVKIFDYVFSMYNKIPHNLRPYVTADDFSSINIDYIITYIENIINAVKATNHSYNDIAGDFSSIISCKNTNDYIRTIDRILIFINNHFVIDKISEDKEFQKFYQEVFNHSIILTNNILRQIKDLEVPTKTDWELEEEKRKERRGWVC